MNVMKLNSRSESLQLFVREETRERVRDMMERERELDKGRCDD